MRLHTRLQQELHARLVSSLPEAVETVWDHAGVVAAVEQLKFTSAGGFEGDWERRATFTGVVRAELRADSIDALPVEPLVADLVSAPLFLDFDPETLEGALSERARATLADWRAIIREGDVASSLRFDVEGTLAMRSGPFERPDLLVGTAPEVGPDHQGDYTSITGEAA